MKTRYISLLFLLLSLIACGSLPVGLPITEELERKSEAEAYYHRARALFIQGDSLSLDSSEAAIELARELVGDKAKFLDALGCIEWARARKELAKFYFRSALQLDSTFSEAYEHLAFVALKEDNFVEAKALFQLSLKHKPSNFRARNNYAVVLAAEGKVISARHQLLKALHGSGSIMRSPVGDKVNPSDSEGAGPIFRNLLRVSN